MKIAQPKRLAVLGAGSHSRINHGPALRICAQQNPERVMLAAVCDLDLGRAQTYAQAFGFEHVYTDLERMLDSEALDGLVAVTPCDQTEALVSALVPYGIPLVIEKPPGPTSQAARRLYELAAQNHLPHMVSFNRRFCPALVRARDWLASHAADRPPQQVIARMVRHARREETFVTETGIHLTDAVASFLGTPMRVVSFNLSSAKGGTGYTQGIASYEQGATANLFFLPASGVVQETYEVYGEDYEIWVDAAACAVRIWDSGAVIVDWSVDQGVPEYVANGTLGETEAFVRAIAGDGSWSPVLQDGLGALLVAEACAHPGEHEIVVY